MKNKIITQILSALFIAIIAPATLFAAQTTEEMQPLDTQLQELIVDVQNIAVDDLLETEAADASVLKSLEERAYALIDSMEEVQGDLTKKEKDATADKIMQCLKVLELFQDIS